MRWFKLYDLTAGFLVSDTAIEFQGLTVVQVSQNQVRSDNSKLDPYTDLVAGGGSFRPTGQFTS